MRRIKCIVFASFLVLSFFLPRMSDAKDAAADSFSLWDTAKHSDASLAPEAIAARDGWKQVADEKASFEGDACLRNNYLALVLRKGCKGAEWYYRLGDKLVKGPTLVPVGVNGDKAKAEESLKAVNVKPDRAAVEATFGTESGRKVASRYLLKGGQPIIETQPGDGTEKIIVEMPSKHAIIPDLYGGDLVMTAQDVQSPRIRFPSENMVLQLADNGNAIVMCVWRSRDQQVNLCLDGTGEGRAISATEIAYKKDKDFPVWVAVMAAPGIWYQQKIAELNPVKDKRLDWKVPFCSQWRADYRRADGLIDSWPLLIKKPSGEFEKPNGKYEGFRSLWLKNRTVTSTARGHFPYPGWVENDTVYLRRSTFEGHREILYKQEGAVVIYPFQRLAKSPPGVFGAMEVLSEALKDTPEAKLPEELPVKPVSGDIHVTTCTVTGEYEKIFEDKEEKAKKAELLKRLEANDRFVELIRSRIVEYMDWYKEAHAFCLKAKAEKPQLAALADEFDGILAKIQKRYDHSKLDERTPEAAKQLGRDLRTIGGRQDHSTGVFRMITKEMRQRAGDCMMEAKDDASFNFAQEIRRRTLEMLQNTLGVENRGFD